MKLFAVIFVTLLFAFVLVWGILLAAKGSFWLLVAGFLTYLVLLIKTGCLPAKPH